MKEVDANQFCSSLKITLSSGPFLGEKLGGTSFIPWPLYKEFFANISEDTLLCL